MLEMTAARMRDVIGAARDRATRPAIVEIEYERRNGYRWYHWDPSKWLIFALSKVGLAWDLRRTSDHRIAEATARGITEAPAH